MKKILVTGGCGYIGSHTLLDLIDNGYEVISVDNNSRSSTRLLEGVEKITGKKIKNYKVDLCDFDDTHAIFAENDDIAGIIHFAAYKAVGESVEKPLLYYHNNLISLINLLKCVDEYQIPYFVFSSSCTVYGSPANIPVTEETPKQPAESPYGYTKQVGEDMITEFAKTSKTQFVLLRYFNPAGAHPSGLLGEYPFDRPQNLTPVITQTAIGKIPQLTVFGSDYNTRDGSCLRDFVHVCDLAHAHTLALNQLVAKKNKTNVEVFNLGTGEGITVLEAIKAFERVAGVSLNYTIGPRRPGDIMAIYANNDKAIRELDWKPRYSLDDIMATAWQWEQNLYSDEKMFSSGNFKLN
ncbi:UDP-glucose 4-epimerase GalE [Pollutibacter soli]|uniref:UDP-glucose 4-epimerase GalE n=1 Tax=Pollutibacter soli TaxID=3034157 RepID=UPI003013B4BC